MPQSPEQPRDPREDLRTFGNLFLVALGMMAGSYRLVMHLPGSPGSRALGMLDAIAVCLVFPLFLCWAPPETVAQAENALLAWRGLWLLFMAQWLCAKLSPAERHSHEVGLPWAGRAEVPAYLAACLGLHLACGPGAALFLALGGACHHAQCRLIRARFRRMGRIVRDQRLEAEWLRRGLHEGP